MRRLKRVCLMVGIVSVVCMIVAVTAGTLYLNRYADSRMDLSLLDLRNTGKPSHLYYYDFTDRAAREGKVCPSEDDLSGTRGESRYVAYQEIPRDLIYAFVAIEDKRFFEHDGVDFQRTVLAGLRYMVGGEKSFGASTITQQLIKNITGRSEYTLDRKFTEIFEALDLERHVDKEEILEVYLNIINLANGCEGVGEAAACYFQKEVGELTLSECACLAAITNNPTRYDPIRHPDRNKERRDLILYEMLDQGYIDRVAYENALQQPVAVNTEMATAEIVPDRIHSWYTDMVIEDVICDLMSTYGYTRRQASGMVYEGDLSIYTAMDPHVQAVLEDYYRDVDHFPQGDKGRPQSAMIVIDPYTGDILGVAGAIGEKRGNRLQNFATDTVRPSGSTIKPLSIYAPCVEKGLISWSNLWEDAPWTEEEMPSALRREMAGTNRVWPRNADGLYRGKITVYEALCKSINTVAVKILREEGLSNAFSFLRDRLHMESLLPPSDGSAGDCTYSSLALGQQSYGVTVRELTGAYSIFENGVYRKPISYYQVVSPDGAVLLSNDGNGEVVLQEQNAALMTRMMQGVMREGSASASTLEQKMGIETAGKTGTTQNACDRWFVGYTPRLLAGVWMGYEYPSTLSGIDGNPCIAIWDHVIRACETIYEGRPKQSRFTSHPDLIRVTYCTDSGELPTQDCADDPRGNRLREGWFVKGTEPRKSCVGVSKNKEKDS